MSACEVGQDVLRLPHMEDFDEDEELEATVFNIPDMAAPSSRKQSIAHDVAAPSSRKQSIAQSIPSFNGDYLPPTEFTLNDLSIKDLSVKALQSTMYEAEKVYDSDYGDCVDSVYIGSPKATSSSQVGTSAFAAAVATPPIYPRQM
ncbi:hypothetical protein DIPPA_09361 [Diplonema papillatum]|nr:hypothetical protein DIPPA_09361 [Diplonema papillatum]|eukprot:gene10191-15676_t